MNLWSLILFVVLLFLGALAYLWYLASQGDIMAITVLIGFGFILLFSVVKGLDILSDWLRDRAENKRFQENMKENFAILNKAYQTQNQAMLGTQRQYRLGSGQKAPASNLDDGGILEVPSSEYYVEEVE